MLDVTNISGIDGDVNALFAVFAVSVAEAVGQPLKMVVRRLGPTQSPREIRIASAELRRMQNSGTENTHREQSRTP